MINRIIRFIKRDYIEVEEKKHLEKYEHSCVQWSPPNNFKTWLVRFFRGQKINWEIIEPKEIGF